MGKSVQDDLDHQDRLAELARTGTYDRAHAEEKTETKLHNLKLEVLATEQELNKLRSDRLKEEQREQHDEAALAAAHRRRDMETTFGIDQATKVTAAVGDNPLVAYALAAERDEISAKELADFHQQEVDRLHALERLREDRAYEDSVKNAELTRDTKVQAIIMRLDIIREMVRKGLLDERGYKEIDGVLTGLVAEKAGELPSTAEPDQGIEASAEPVLEEPSAAQPNPELEATDDEPYREEDL